MYTIESIEKRQNIVFPIEYKKLYEDKFVICGGKHTVYCGNDIFEISKFLSASEIQSVIDELFDILGYDIIPIAETDYEDYICLYYKDGREKPVVAYLNYELAMERDEEYIQVLYDNLSEFLCKLK